MAAKVNIETKWKEGKKAGGYGKQAVSAQWNSFSIRSTLLLGMQFLEAGNISVTLC